MLHFNYLLRRCHLSESSLPWGCQEPISCSRTHSTQWTLPWW